MKHTIIAFAAAATLAAALPSSAQANCRGCGVAAGVVGGLRDDHVHGGAGEREERSRMRAVSAERFDRERRIDQRDPDRLGGN